LTDIFGNIVIGDNCFIGAHAIILPGVNICNNVIIASGSVVTRSILEENVIFGGNPAKRIGSWDQFMDKNREIGLNVSGLSWLS
jgi:acetyltransferase-like isoleucine patch superfamily enzyme